MLFLYKFINFIINMLLNFNISNIYKVKSTIKRKNNPNVKIISIEGFIIYLEGNYKNLISWVDTFRISNV